ncbi:unnamed protein product [Chilo suppressalis]|uniref:Uncharacterized protein n=1 Tax=Chilo suppressalis TaxID=168631 RepID=A0ABN8AYU2_CHISP|nr:unnamed protein product [Chilo suppressalis]
MNFAKMFLFVFAVFLATSSVSAAPKWKIFKKIERVGQHIRDGIIKAGPAVEVVGQAASIYKEKAGRNIRDGIIKAAPAVEVVGQAATIYKG